MTDDENAGRWPLSEVAARQIKRIRGRDHINRDELARRCRELGAPDNFTAAAIANIETGRPGPSGKRRRDITVEELVIFARALNVPPLLLLFDVGRVEDVEVLPDLVVPTWLAVEWFTGESELPDLSEADSGAWLRNTAPVTLFREHAQLIQAWAKVMRSSWAVEETEAEVDAVMRRKHAEQGEVVTALHRVRDSMRMLGLRPPPVTDEGLANAVGSLESPTKGATSSDG